MPRAEYPVRTGSAVGGGHCTPRASSETQLRQPSGVGGRLVGWGRGEPGSGPASADTAAGVRIQDRDGVPKPHVSTGESFPSSGLPFRSSPSGTSRLEGVGRRPSRAGSQAS